MGDEEGAFLRNLGNVDSDLFFFQRDNISNQRVVKCGLISQMDALSRLHHYIQRYDGKGVSFPCLDVVGDAKNLSREVLEKITDQFCDENFILDVPYGKLFRGFIDDGQEGRREVTVKTWEFVFPAARSYSAYPKMFRDEIILLERSEMKSHPFLVKLFGFCFDKKLAVVYDLKFNKPFWQLLKSAEFGWKQRMKVATDYALLLKTLSSKQFDVCCNGSSDIVIIDEEYNIKLLDFCLSAFPQTLGIYYSATVSDPALTGKKAAFELGLLLLKLVTKKVCKWNGKSRLDSYIAKMNRGSIVDESFEIDDDTGTRITQLIKSCVNQVVDERPNIDTVFDELVKINKYRPAVSDSYPWIDSP